MIPSGVNSCQMPIKFMKEEMGTISSMERMARQQAFRRLLVKVERTLSALSSTKALTKPIQLISQFGVIGIMGLEQSMMTRFNMETLDWRRSSGVMMTKSTSQMELWNLQSPKRSLLEMVMTSLTSETIGQKHTAMEAVVMILSTCQ